MKAFNDFEVFPLGDRGILIRWELQPSDALLDHLLLQKAKLAEALRIEIIHSYTELLLKASPEAFPEIQLRNLLNADTSSVSRQRVQYEIPVCYGGDFGMDLLAFAKAKHLSVEEVIAIHTNQTYRLYFMGFLPGFLYLEGLDERLHCPRKATPTMHIVPGSVAIGGTQTGIYPQASPGGWHCIGRTPISMFDPTAAEPSPFKAGDLIQFTAIETDLFEMINSQVVAGTYHLKKTLLEK